MTPEIKPEFRGAETVAVSRDVEGPTDYVPGRGADMVPSRIGTGRLEVHRVLGGEDVHAPSVLFTIDGLSHVGIQVVRTRVEALQGEDGTGDVTQEAVLQALAA